MTLKYEEEIAVSFVAKWVGSRGSVRGLGNGDNPDFEIMYGDGSIAVGEIKSDEDEESKSQWATITKRPGTQIFELPAGSSSWSIRLHKGANIKVLEESLPQIIESLKSRKLTEWIPEYVYPESDDDEILISLGILDILSTQIQGRDIAWIQPDGFGGAVPIDANMAIPWIDAMFAVERWKKSWARIDASGANEGHAFFWIGSNSPIDLRIRASFHPDEPPTLSPNLPKGFTHIWVGVGSSFGQHRSAWVYEKGKSWELVKILIN